MSLPSSTSGAQSFEESSHVGDIFAMSPTPDALLSPNHLERYQENSTPVLPKLDSSVIGDHHSSVTGHPLQIADELVTNPWSLTN